MAQSARVLIIDDDSSIREFLRMGLSDEGYIVQTARTGEAALDLIYNFRPNLIILDVHPFIYNVQGYIAAYRRLFTPRIPVVAVSTSPLIAKKAPTLDVDAFLPKPFDLDELLTLIRKNSSSSLLQ
jgi:DNA-binding response OmpR family regulator